MALEFLLATRKFCHNLIRWPSEVESSTLARMGVLQYFPPFLLNTTTVIAARQQTKRIDAPAERDDERRARRRSCILYRNQVLWPLTSIKSSTDKHPFRKSPILHEQAFSAVIHSVKVIPREQIILHFANRQPHSLWTDNIPHSSKWIVILPPVLQDKYLLPSHWNWNSSRCKERIIYRDFYRTYECHPIFLRQIRHPLLFLVLPPTTNYSKQLMSISIIRNV